ncbi:MAG: DUF3313 domain-containing protein [Planctomycetota bacterium]|jgi:hypothetical protein
MRHFISALSLASVLLTGACSSPDTSPSGFLSNFSQLGGGYDTANSVAGYLSPGADMSRFDSILFDPVVTIIDAEAVDSAVAEQLAAYMHESLRAEFGKKFKLVDTPGATTARVRTALTDIIAGQPATKPVTLAFPQPSGRLSGNLATQNVADFVANVSFEGEVLDSSTGERLVAVSDQRFGVKREATPDTTWETVREMVQEGAVNLRRRTEGLR